MKFIVLLSVMVLTAFANAQTAVNSENTTSASGGVLTANNMPPREIYLVTNQRLIVTSASDKKFCGYLATDPKKTPMCVPDDPNERQTRALYDFVVASDIATCGHIQDGKDTWQCWGVNPVLQPLDLSFLNGTKPANVFNFESNLCRIDAAGILLCARPTSWTSGTFAIDMTSYLASPKQFGPFKHFKTASADYAGLCVIDGEDVKCQTGAYSPVAIAGVKFSHPRLVSVSRTTICVLDDSGARCWADSGAPIQAPADWKNALTIRAEQNGTCAALANGTISCFEPLGGHLSVSNAERLPQNLAGVVEYESNGSTSCARLANGTLRCWGRIPESYRQPENLKQVLNVSIGTRHICASFQNGEAACWGDNAHGELNLPIKAGTTPHYAVNTGIDCVWTQSDIVCSGNVYSANAGHLPKFNHVLDLSLSSADRMGDSCAIDQTPNGSTKAVCWGYEKTVVDVPATLKNPSIIATSGGDACADSAGNSIQCWGKSQIGNAPNSTRHLRKIVVAGNNACAIDDYGLMCWGEGQSTDSKMKVPDSLAMDGATIDVALGIEQACALTFDHAVVCWGDGDTRVPELKHPIAVNVASDRTFCATDDDGVKCWGLAGARLPGRPH